jgi:hypothetical protein
MLRIVDESGRNLLHLLATMWNEGEAASPTRTNPKPSMLT